MQPFLATSAIIDRDHPDVTALAWALANGSTTATETAKRCFEWVRDEIKHSHDYLLQPVTCSASQTLHVGSGFCYAKSHLLAALLRANGLPAGLCYQRLSRDGNGGPPFCLHGFNAVFLPEFGWYRIDPRGNREGINAQFAPPIEHLAFASASPGEADLARVWAEPLPAVLDALWASSTATELWANLPDLALNEQGELDGTSSPAR